MILPYLVFNNRGSSPSSKYACQEQWEDGSTQGWLNNEIELMQYTGLRDKNGKEIYEGDILKHDLWGITKVYWEQGMFRADNGKEGDKFVDVVLGDHQLKRTRIIGNIYEDSDLLRD